MYGAFTDINPLFTDITIGIDSAEPEVKFGKPSTTENIGVYGEFYHYEHTNYSFEVKDGLLSSIKISAPNDKSIESNIEKLPKLADIKKLFNEKTRASLAKILSPEMEIYNGDEVKFFNYAWEDEIHKDLSVVYAFIETEVANALDKITPENYETNIRIMEYQEPFGCYKILELSS